MVTSIYYQKLPKTCTSYAFLAINMRCLYERGMNISMKIDLYSTKILDILQKDGRSSVQAISDQVGLSTAPCWRRIKDLEESGVIRKYVSLLDRTKIGLSTCMLTSVSLDRHSLGVVEDFERTMFETPEILECWVTTGDADYLLKIFVSDPMAFDHFLHRVMFKLKGIRQMRTAVALREVKCETRLPLPF